MKHGAWNGRAIFGTLPKLTVDSDACTYGWEASCKRLYTRDLWTAQERSLHINAQELLAISFTIQSFTKDRTNVSIHLRMDNVSAVR